MLRLATRIFAWLAAIYGGVSWVVDTISRVEWIRDHWPDARRIAQWIYPYLGDPPVWATSTVFLVGVVLLVRGWRTSPVPPPGIIASAQKTLETTSAVRIEAVADLNDEGGTLVVETVDRDVRQEHAPTGKRGYGSETSPVAGQSRKIPVNSRSIRELPLRSAEERSRDTPPTATSLSASSQFPNDGATNADLPGISGGS